MQGEFIGPLVETPNGTMGGFSRKDRLIVFWKIPNPHSIILECPKDKNNLSDSENETHVVRSREYAVGLGTPDESRDASSTIRAGLRHHSKDYPRRGVIGHRTMAGSTVSIFLRTRANVYSLARHGDALANWKIER